MEAKNPDFLLGIMAIFLNDKVEKFTYFKHGLHQLQNKIKL